jgi:hypothetical protein
MASEINNTENVLERISDFRVNSEVWEGHCGPSDQTKTPGVFYHGSANLGIVEFEQRISLTPDVSTEGIFFTHNPTYAAIYAADRGYFRGGRIYRVELVTNCPFVPDKATWFTALDSREAERSWCSEARDYGFDCIIQDQYEGYIRDMVVLDSSVIRRLDAYPHAIEAVSAKDLLFYQREPEPGSDFEGCLSLSKDPVDAQRYGGVSRPVYCNARIPVFCEKFAWSQMDFDVLRYLKIDLLIDPMTGDGLAVHPSRVEPLNRQERRALRKEKRLRELDRERHDHFMQREEGASFFSADLNGPKWSAQPLVAS